MRSTQAFFQPQAPLRHASLVVALLCAGFLSACSVAPVYEVPAMQTPTAFKEAGAWWQPAEPADALERGQWWQLFGDATLNQLADQVQLSNQNIAAAVAAVAQAQAAVQQTRAGLWPSAALSLAQNRQGGSQAAGKDSASLSLNAAWDADLWARLRQSHSSAQASAQASVADLAAARLSAIGSLVQGYFKLREADAEMHILQTAIEGYQRSLAITQNRYTAGVEARTAVLQAQTTLATAQASLHSVGQTRQTYEHAIAVLTGQMPAHFSLPPAPWQAVVPSIPAVLPSTLLQRRPDIAAAERAVAAANAQIGVARAAYYPSLGLNGSLARSGSKLGDLWSASGLLWSLGASVGQTIFNAGATTAQVDAALAAHASKAASYRQTVLSAFQAVEDVLGEVAALHAQQPLLQQSLDAAAQVEQQMLNRYKEGLVQYTEVVNAQATALNARRALIQLQLGQQLAAARLIQELGGGWQASWLVPAGQAVDTTDTQ